MPARSPHGSFARFVQARRLGRHFGGYLPLSLSMVGHWLGRDGAREPDAADSTGAERLATAALSPDRLLASLGSRADGLTDAEAAAIRARCGANLVEHEPPLPAWRHLWQCYRNPFNLLLSALAALSWLTDDLRATLVMAAMVLLSVGIRFVQEGRSQRAADALKELVGNRAAVLRRGAGAGGADGAAGAINVAGTTSASLQRVELPIRDLVPGDILVLAAGDMVPADARLLASKDLFVSQAAMTGESLPVEKFAQGGAVVPASALDSPALVFMGSNIVSGTATAVVVATGRRTLFGQLAHSAGAARREPTAFETGVNRTSWLLIRFAAVMVPLVFVINGWLHRDWLQALLFAVSVAVGLTPEMLPMIVTATLARGAVTMARRKVVVKRLDAIQNFGAMDVLCTDKTGTLTQDRIVLERHVDALGQPDAAVLEMAYLNSHFQTGLRNLLDVAVLDHVDVGERLRLDADYRKVDEIPFDFERRRMSVVVAEREHHHELICKGALDEVLALCTRVHTRDGDLALEASADAPSAGPRADAPPADASATAPATALRARIRAVADALNEDGLRVVAVAMKEVPPDKEVYGVADEADLTLVGFIAFLDPPKDSAAPALRALAASGITVKVLTGDNAVVARKVCRDVGLAVRGTLLGPEAEALDDAALARAVEENTLFARLAPAHKERIVRALRGNGHVVGFMGDGINDAPAIHAADIGISVDTAVDIAKEAADIILLERSLLVLQEGVVEGRRVFANMLKYLRMTASSNFGNVLSVLAASALLPFLPMLPIQLLTQNLLYDFAQTAIPFDRVDADQTATPQRWDAGDLGRFMLRFGPVSSVFDLATFALIWWVIGAGMDRASDGFATLFRSGWFVEGLLSQVLIVHCIRTRALPFVESRAAPALIGASVAVAALGIFLVNGPFAGAFRFTALPWGYFPWLIAVLLGYAALVQFMKGRHAVAITRPRAQQVERASERGNTERAEPAQQRDAR
ncbi:HAD-IC family P-type ATPase [Derxia gummosa]|uniref:Magnesium-transporting ATPase, P-type 1 n=1 Tax=Derxia gummosa DSM 723 TaxID=1121388 RepID=A0A8B6XCW4_9BURK|nr:HAD-IC family P-type ATPase [Derxia gummosa]